MSDESLPPPSELLLYRGQDERTRLEVRLSGDSVWLSQRQIAALYDVSVPTVNEHLAAAFEEGELEPERTIRKFRIVQVEGAREVRRLVDHYALAAILAVGYRVHSARGTQFRQWATERQYAIHRQQQAAMPSPVDQAFEAVAKALPKTTKDKDA